ncbi:hypothetical protein CDAR_532771 [Caerostris darwini]|uniref:Secreted protein n=1 Tax=Caerostris darwini TaxID=1538125 RepID=A0AAV4VY67_9ARAC|nr:hypothetical protein CDAR_532771 [Caerostris darwini]
MKFAKLLPALIFVPSSKTIPARECATFQKGALSYPRTYPRYSKNRTHGGDAGSTASSPIWRQEGSSREQRMTTKKRPTLSGDRGDCSKRKVSKVSGRDNSRVRVHN